MGISEEIIMLLEKNRGEYVSGSDIAKQLNVSRNAVWKTIKSLTDDGYCIDAITNKGYCLLLSNDILSEIGIKKYLNQKNCQFKFEIYDTVTSTNTLLKALATENVQEGMVIASVEQSEGRGRFGRNFYSPEDTGLYFSLLLRPDFTADCATLITTAAAVALCEAIEEIAKVKPQIKWVNDIYINGKKTAGILTEATFNPETNVIDSVILGVGVNIYAPKNGFPPELESIAGYVLDRPVGDVRNRLLAEFLNRFWIIYKDLGNRKFVIEYKKRSFILNREILVYKKDGKISAIALDIDDRCRLLVRYEDGNCEYLSSGEISIKPINNK